MQVAEKKEIIAAFLNKANDYARRMIDKYTKALEDENDFSKRLALYDKINHWAAYQAFNAYTIEELQSSELDQWFD
jgi:hypothetical protein